MWFTEDFGGERMRTYLEDEVNAIKHFRMIKMSRGNNYVSLDDATKEFVEKYAAEYEKIWYAGIRTEEIRLRLFAPDSNYEDGRIGLY